MRINEVFSPQPDVAKLAALADFLTGRAEDRSAPKKISTDAFISLAKNMKISMTLDQLKNLSQQEPLSNIIRNVEDDTVIFHDIDDPSGEEPNDTMDVQQAQATVDKMAKRAAKKKGI